VPRTPSLVGFVDLKPEANVHYRARIISNLDGYPIYQASGGIEQGIPRHIDQRSRGLDLNCLKIAKLPPFIIDKEAATVHKVEVVSRHSRLHIFGYSGPCPEPVVI